MDITDLIQDGTVGLIMAVDRLDMDMALEKDNPEKSIKSFFSKRVKGAIRRAIDMNRGSKRIPEHKLADIRNKKEDVDIFDNSIFQSIDAYQSTENPYYYIPDIGKEYRVDILNGYLLGLMKKHLTKSEYEVVRMSYGLDCDKMSALEIAIHINIVGSSAHVRISQMKKQAVTKLIDSIDPEQVIDFL